MIFDEAFGVVNNGVGRGSARFSRRAFVVRVTAIFARCVRLLVDSFLFHLQRFAGCSSLPPSSLSSLLTSPLRFSRSSGTFRVASRVFDRVLVCGYVSRGITVPLLASSDGVRPLCQVVH